MVLLAMLWGGAGCDGKPEPPPDTQSPETVSWAVDIAPVMYRACMGCHVGESVLEMDEEEPLLGILFFPLPQILRD